MIVTLVEEVEKEYAGYFKYIFLFFFHAFGIYNLTN
jgi:hypothetical protein